MFIKSLAWDVLGCFGSAAQHPIMKLKAQEGSMGMARDMLSGPIGPRCVKASSGWKLSHHVGGRPRAWLSLLSTQAPQGGVSSHEIALVVEIGTQVSLSG